MLTVDVSKRITIDECLEHPWVRNVGYINPADSTDGLTGRMSVLDFTRRKVQRERTLLANINDVKVSKIVNVAGQVQGHPDRPSSPAHVKVWAKNPEGKNIKMSPVRNGNGEELRREKEEHPAANRQEEEFMGMGGKGDMLLFADDVSSRYLPEEVPKEK
jgi:serine/threonine-protein kinase CHEK2